PVHMYISSIMLSPPSASDPRHTTALFSKTSAPTPVLHSFPTRRSSDLHGGRRRGRGGGELRGRPGGFCGALPATPARLALAGVADRKSTRLNSSHDQISYAVFCLKKKTASSIKGLARRLDRAPCGEIHD